MTPAHPPLPTASNLPFQSFGSQISTLMSESAEGVSVAATRQNSGTLYSFPTGTTSARVIAVPFSTNFARSAQGTARAGAADGRSAAARARARIVIGVSLDERPDASPRSPGVHAGGNLEPLRHDADDDGAAVV